MKANLTLKLDKELIREARIMAAEEGSSISALLAENLANMVRRRKNYHLAKQRALSRLKEGYNLRWKRPASRDELHEG
jgi:hypothetical protein